ncbi:MAG: hypothetical protein M2R45_01990 [Verrucomicrobia subdivision 3 bacterium]|nr:hypothetical protein [Limisphaerales bacterium]MCS1414808.1 hypothetical protein [Limisphaerales bacterium]
MNQYTSKNFPNTRNQFPAAYTAKLGSVRNLTKTILVFDLAFARNHPLIVNLSTDNLGYRHGQRHPLGSSVTLFAGAHVEGTSQSQTNGIIFDFKRDPDVVR